MSQYAAVCKNEADRIGDRRAAAGAVGGELALVHLDQVLRLTTGAVDHVPEVLGRAAVEIAERTLRPKAIASMRAQTRRSTFQDFGVAPQCRSVLERARGC